MQNKDFLAVVADKEWNAIRAARKLKVTWSKRRSRHSPTRTALYDHIRKAPVRKREVEASRTAMSRGLQTAARVIEAEYEWPFQSHASMGPACARRRDRRTAGDGVDRHAEAAFAATASPRMLGVPAEKVHACWMFGPGSYGRNDAGDAAGCRGAVAGRRQAGARAIHAREGTAGTRKAPASVHRARAGIDANGKVIAYEFVSKGFSRIDIDTNESEPRDTLAGQLLGVPLELGRRFGVPAESYAFANKRVAGRRSRRCSTAPRRCAPRICAIPSGRRSSSPANPSSTRWRPRSTWIRSSSACAISRSRATWRWSRRRPRRRRLADAAIAARATSSGDMLTGRGIAYAQRTAPSSPWSPRSRSTAGPARSGRASSPSPMIAA